MSDLGVTPERVAVRDVRGARHALAAAYLYGQDLRQLFPVWERASHDGGPVPLHADSFDQIVDVGGVADRRRDPDEDAVLVQCVRPAPSGGDSFVLDAYRYLDSLADTELIARRTDGAVPLHRDPAAQHVTAMLDRFHRTVRELEPDLPRFPLGTGEILAIDNYRCWHGRDPHTGDRVVRILTMRTAAAR